MSISFHLIHSPNLGGGGQKTCRFEICRSSQSLQSILILIFCRLIDVYYISRNEKERSNIITSRQVNEILFCFH